MKYNVRVKRGSGCGLRNITQVTEVVNLVSNSEKFLNAYAVIEHELQKILDLKERRRFYDLVDRGAQKNPVISRYKFDLKEYGDLRNAIVHDRADGQIIAEPNDNAVAGIEKIAGLLLQPPRVIPLFQKEVLALAAGDPVTKAIRAMSKFAYTQVPVTERDTVVGLLTSQMVVRWMGESLEEGSLAIERTSVGDLLRYAGTDRDNFLMVASTASLFEVLDLFYRHQVEGGKLEAVLITLYGRSSEPLLGIITNRDLPLLQRHLEQRGRA